MYSTILFQIHNCCFFFAKIINIYNVLFIKPIHRMKNVFLVMIFQVYFYGTLYVKTDMIEMLILVILID